MFPYNVYAQKQKENQAFKDRQNEKKRLLQCDKEKQTRETRTRERCVCVCVYNMMKCNNKQNEEKRKDLIFLKFYQFIEIRICDCIKIVQELVGDEISSSSSSSSDCIDGEQLSGCSS